MAEVLIPQERTTEFVPFLAKDPIKLSVKIVQSMLCRPTKSGKVCDANQAMRFIMLCKARALNPFEGDAFCIGYDTKDGAEFNLITAHQAFLKRAEVHPEYDGMDSGVIVQTKGGEIVDREGDFTFDDEKLMGGWAVVFFKSRSHPMKRRLKLQTFKKNFGRWVDDSAGMIVKCAEADALRSSFPNSLGGMYLEDELGPRHIAETISKPPVGRTNLRTVQPSLPQPSQSVPDRTTDELPANGAHSPPLDVGDGHGDSWEGGPDPATDAKGPEEA